jgi:hypothetical protein
MDACGIWILDASRALATCTDQDDWRRAAQTGRRWLANRALHFSGFGLEDALLVPSLDRRAIELGAETGGGHGGLEYYNETEASDPINNPGLRGLGHDYQREK